MTNYHCQKILYNFYIKQIFFIKIFNYRETNLVCYLEQNNNRFRHYLVLWQYIFAKKKTCENFFKCSTVQFLLGNDYFLDPSHKRSAGSAGCIAWGIRWPRWSCKGPRNRKLCHINRARQWAAKKNKDDTTTTTTWSLGAVRLDPTLSWPQLKRSNRRRRRRCPATDPLSFLQRSRWFLCSGRSAVNDGFRSESSSRSSRAVRSWSERSGVEVPMSPSPRTMSHAGWK